MKCFFEEITSILPSASATSSVPSSGTENFLAAEHLVLSVLLPDAQMLLIKAEEKEGREIQAIVV